MLPLKLVNCCNLSYAQIKHQFSFGFQANRITVPGQWSKASYLSNLWPINNARPFLFAKWNHFKWELSKIVVKTYPLATEFTVSFSSLTELGIRTHALPRSSPLTTFLGEKKKSLTVMHHYSVFLKTHTRNAQLESDLWFILEDRGGSEKIISILITFEPQPSCH